MNTPLTHVSASLLKLQPFKKLVVGLSGGVDSVVLTHILKSLGYELIVAHLNHQLRGADSDRDEAFVKETAKAWGLAYVSKKVSLPKDQNIENSGRRARYEFFENVRHDFDADLIAVGHHFDDQIETVLMHEKRGAGLRGKRGMRILSGKIIRPLLEVSRHDIEAYATANQLAYVQDETNLDIRYTRNHLRHEIIPRLRKKAGFEAGFRQQIQMAGFELKRLTEQKEAWLKSNLRNDGFERAAFNTLEQPLQAEILIDLLGQEDLYGKTLRRLIDFIANASSGKELTVKDVSFVIEYDRVHWHLKPQQIHDDMPLSVGETTWGNYRIKITAPLILKVRSWRPGDRFQPSGMQGTKKLQDFFTDAKIPRHQRAEVAVIVNEDDEIVCVGDLRFDKKWLEIKDSIVIRSFHK